MPGPAPDPRRAPPAARGAGICPLLQPAAAAPGYRAAAPRARRACGGHPGACPGRPYPGRPTPRLPARGAGCDQDARMSQTARTRAGKVLSTTGRPSPSSRVSSPQGGNATADMPPPWPGAYSSYSSSSISPSTSCVGTIVTSGPTSPWTRQATNSCTFPASGSGTRWAVRVFFTRSNSYPTTS